MTSRTSFSTRDLESAEEFLSGAFLDVSLVQSDDHGAFELANSNVDVGQFRLDELAISSNSAFSYEAEDAYFVSFVAAGSLRLREDGVDERVERGGLLLVGRPGVLSTTEVADFHQEVITLHPRAIREVVGLEPDQEAPVFTSPRPISPERARAWRLTQTFVIEALAGESGDSPLFVGGVNRMLAGLLLDTFPNTAVAPPARRDDRAARSPGVLRRAIGFIEANPDRDIGVFEIAAAAGVSPRAVQLAFRRHLETTPTGYLRRVRLQYAHRELVDASPGDGLTVTDVAYRWGFSSPSRFAERYRAAYGMPPSEILRG